MKYLPVRSDALKIIQISPANPPYFFKNPAWYYFDNDDEECSIKLTEKAPAKARESYQGYMGYYDEKEKANVYGFVPEELSFKID